MNAQKITTKAPGRDTTSRSWTDEEKSAMKERAKELKAEQRRGAARADGERDLLEKVGQMPEADRVMAERIHAVITASAPNLAPKTWYGMPAYANEGGKIVCFFQPADKFKARYATFGFNDDAKLDDGNMWPTSWALTKLTAADEKKIGELVRKAVG